jgi:hypothetical protein
LTPLEEEDEGQMEEGGSNREDEQDVGVFESETEISPTLLLDGNIIGHEEDGGSMCSNSESN